MSNAPRQEVDRIKAAVLGRVTQNNFVSFAELDRNVEGFRGDNLALTFEDLPNIICWWGMTQAAVEAVVELIIERKVWQAPASKLVYLIDGGFLPNMPIARSARAYKEPHWLPITLCRPGTKGAIDPDKKKSRLGEMTEETKEKGKVA